jgi:hypothetical protein
MRLPWGHKPRPADSRDVDHAEGVITGTEQPFDQEADEAFWNSIPVITLRPSIPFCDVT